LRCRVGISTGPVIIGDAIGAGEAQEGDIVGEARPWSAFRENFAIFSGSI
jgi:hypothetical protein